MSRVQIGIIALVACFSWSSASVLTKYLLNTVPPLPLLILQVSASAAAMLVLVIPAHGLRRTLSGWRLSWLGILQPGIAYGLSTYGLEKTSASVEVLVWALDPVMVIGLAWVLVSERPPRRLLAGVSACLFGNLLVALGEALSTGISASALAIGLVAAGVAASASYTVMLKKLGGTEPVLLMVFWNQVGGLVTFALAACVLGANTLGMTMPLLSLVGLSGILLHAIPFVLLAILLQQVRAGSAGLLTPLVSVVTLSIATVVLGERLSTLQYIGAAVVAIGSLWLPLEGRVAGAPGRSGK